MIKNIKILNNKIKINGKKYTVEPILKREDLKERADLYLCCWDKAYDIMDFKGFLTIKDKKKIIGTVRYVKSGTKINVSMWIEKYKSLSEDSMKILQKELDKLIQDKDLKKYELNFMPHYKNLLNINEVFKKESKKYKI